MTNDEIIQLKTTAIALREELERSRIAYEENAQKIKRAARDEVKQLQETITALREGLENGDPE